MSEALWSSPASLASAQHTGGLSSTRGARPPGPGGLPSTRGARPRGRPSTRSTRPPGRRGGWLSWVLQQTRAPYVQLLIGHVCLGGTAAVANVLMARALAPSGRGLIALLLQVAYLSSQLLLLGSERSFIASYHGSSPAAGVRAYASLVARPCAAALAVVALAAAFVPPQLRPTRTVLVLIAAFATVNVLMQALRAVAIASNRYTGYLTSTIVSQFLVLATMTGLFLTGVTNTSAWFLAYVLANAVPTAVCAIRWSRVRDGGASAAVTTVEIDQRKLVRREGLALLPAAVANTGMLRFDRLILPALASTAALGLYAAVATITELVCWPLQAYADSRLGAWRAAHKVGGLRISPVIVRAVVYAVVVGPVLGVATYLLIVPLFGERYAAAKGLVLPLAVAAGLYAISRLSLALLIARGRNLLASATETSGFVTSLVAYLALIPHHGALGAAYGSLIGYGTCLIFGMVSLRVSGSRFYARPVPVEQQP